MKEDLRGVHGFMPQPQSNDRAIQAEYGKVILPFTVLRRLDCVLESTKVAVLAELEKRTKVGVNPEPFLLRKAGQLFYNISPLDLKKLMGDQDHIGENLRVIQDRALAERYTANYIIKVAEAFRSLIN